MQNNNTLARENAGEISQEACWKGHALEKRNVTLRFSKWVTGPAEESSPWPRWRRESRVGRTQVARGKSREPGRRAQRWEKESELSPSLLGMPKEGSQPQRTGGTLFRTTEYSLLSNHFLAERAWHFPSFTGKEFIDLGDGVTRRGQAASLAVDQGSEHGFDGALGQNVFGFGNGAAAAIGFQLGEFLLQGGQKVGGRLSVGA